MRASIIQKEIVDYAKWAQCTEHVSVKMCGIETQTPEEFQWNESWKDPVNHRCTVTR